MAADDAGANTELERSAIEITRRTENEKLDIRAVDCQRKFASTACLDSVRMDRLAIEAQLKRREEALKNQQRHQRGQEQLDRSRDKAETHARRLASTEGTAERVKKIPRPPQPAKVGEAPSGAEATQVLSEQQRRANVEEYERRQVQAAAKRAEVAKKIQEQRPVQIPLPRQP